MRFAFFQSGIPIRIAVTLTLLGACTQVPELDASLPKGLKNADYPDLVPIETLISAEVAPQERVETQRDDLQARRDLLKARAKQLNTAVVDQKTRDRMNAGVTPPG